MIKIIAVDDDSAYLEYLAEDVFPPSDKDFRLIKRISHMSDQYNIEFMLGEIKKLTPDIILMDLSFALVDRPHDYGVELVRIILEKHPEQKIIMLVGDQADDSDTSRADKIYRSFQAGAVAYLSKREIIHCREAINEVINGDRYISRETSKLWLNGIRSKSVNTRTRYGLGPRHIEVLWLLSMDNDIAVVAKKMKNKDGGEINYHTVSFHLSNIRQMLGVKTLQGMVAKALREKIID